MDNQELTEKLSHLMQWDIDAVGAYNQALENIDDAAIHGQISSFRDDHGRHIVDLKEVILQYGGQPPEISADFKGFMIKGFTALRGITGIEGSLKAMESNEGLTNKIYLDALDWNLPPDVKILVEKNYEDEKIHLQTIRQLLRAKPWQSKAA